MMRSKRVVMTSMVAAGALLFSACGGDDGGGSASDWCTVARSFSESEAVESALDDDMSPEQMKAGMQEAKKAFEALQKAAPSEIKDDVNTVVSGFNTLVDALEDVDYDFMALFGDEEAMAALETLDSQEFTDAQDNVDAYTLEQCGFSLDGSDESTSTGGGTGTDTDTDTDSDTGTDSGSSEETSMPDFSGDNMTEMLADTYASMFGIDQTKATCLAEKLVESGAAMGASDDAMNQIFDFLDECNISIAELGGGG